MTTSDMLPRINGSAGLCFTTSFLVNALHGPYTRHKPQRRIGLKVLPEAGERSVDTRYWCSASCRALPRRRFSPTANVLTPCFRTVPHLYNAIVVAPLIDCLFELQGPIQGIPRTWPAALRPTIGSLPLYIRSTRPHPQYQERAGNADLPSDNSVAPT